MSGEIIIISSDSDADTDLHGSHGRVYGANNSKKMNPRTKGFSQRRPHRWYDDEEEEEGPIIASNFFSEADLDDIGLPTSPEDVAIVAQRGQTACRDFPHSRHLCGKYPFSTTPHKSYCGMCYCYVCDKAAPCKYWNSHCNASDEIFSWKNLRETFQRKNLRETLRRISSKKKVADVMKVADTVERRESKVDVKKEKIVILIESSDEDEDEDDNDDCVEIDPIEFTSKLRLDDLDPAADVVAVACKGPVALRDFPHPRHLCGNFPFNTTDHESYCSKCFCYVCEIAAPCLGWRGTNGHCSMCTEADKLKAIEACLVATTK